METLFKAVVMRAATGSTTQTPPFGLRFRKGFGLHCSLTLTDGGRVVP